MKKIGIDTGDYLQQIMEIARNHQGGKAPAENGWMTSSTKQADVGEGQYAGQRNATTDHSTPAERLAITGALIGASVAQRLSDTFQKGLNGTPSFVPLSGFLPNFSGDIDLIRKPVSVAEAVLAGGELLRPSDKAVQKRADAGNLRQAWEFAVKDAQKTLVKSVAPLLAASAFGAPLSAEQRDEVVAAQKTYQESTAAVADWVKEAGQLELEAKELPLTFAGTGSFAVAPNIAEIAAGFAIETPEGEAEFRAKISRHVSERYPIQGQFQQKMAQAVADKLLADAKDRAEARAAQETAEKSA